LFIGGRWQAAQSGETFEVVDPANEQVFARAAAGARRILMLREGGAQGVRVAAVDVDDAGATRAAAAETRRPHRSQRR
jgi:acyl-CoA reductase-like NAD-dependent aldehyde dehydrogenase